jgi:hypothetical protein
LLVRINTTSLALMMPSGAVHPIIRDRAAFAPFIIRQGPDTSGDVLRRTVWCRTVDA